MDKNYKKAVITFFISVITFIGGVILLDSLNRNLSEDIEAAKVEYEKREKIRNSPTEILFPEEVSPETNESKQPAEVPTEQ